MKSILSLALLSMSSASYALSWERLDLQDDSFVVTSQNHDTSKSAGKVAVSVNRNTDTSCGLGLSLTNLTNLELIHSQAPSDFRQCDVSTSLGNGIYNCHIQTVGSANAQFISLNSIESTDTFIVDSLMYARSLTVSVGKENGKSVTYELSGLRAQIGDLYNWCRNE